MVDASRPESGFDFRNPDYVPIFAARAQRLQWLRTPAGRRELPALRAYYKTHIPDFINDWAVTVDPRVTAKGRSAIMPFLLFPRQREMVEWILESWRESRPGICDKSRDVGASWVALAVGCSLCIFHHDISIGVGSYVEDKVDRSGDPDTLFYKARMFMQYIPVEFRAGWTLAKHSAHMRLQFPETGSSITGEAGDNVGRGGRKTIYFVDESAHLERPQLIDASLSANTDCRLDFSSVNGTDNPFAQKRHSWPSEQIFTFHWRDDPRKDEAWYAKKCSELDPIVVAQEIDLNYSASKEGVIIPSQWVQAAIDAHVKLGIEPTGQRHSALDVADEGADKNAWAAKHGVHLFALEEWSGVNSDIYDSTVRAFALCDAHNVPSLEYDGDGLGAACKGDARKINEARAKDKRPALRVAEYRGSAAVLFPEAKVRGPDGKDLDIKNKDYYLNKAAQDWFALRFRFQQTFRAVSLGLPYDPEDIISIDSTLPQLAKLTMELSQPTWKPTNTGKVQVVKKPEGARSPNLADAVRMLYGVRRRAMAISDSTLENA